MAGLSALQNPLSGLFNLNTLLSWRGTFDPNVTYFQNDLVVSSNNNSTYLLNATSAFGEDPSLNPNWISWGLVGGGVQVAQGSQYIEVSGSGTNPTVSNLGVIETILTPPLYSSSGDPQNPLINSSAIATIQGVLGISVVGNQITNTGVCTLTDGAGISSVLDPDTGIAEISNAGVTALTPEDKYITITGTNAVKTIANGGILSVTADAGLTNVGTPTDVQLRNDYVLDITSPDDSVSITDNSSQYKLECLVPELTVCFSSITFNKAKSTPNFNLVQIDVVQQGGSLFSNCLASGTPYSAGVFYIDFSPLLLVFGSSWWSSQAFSIGRLAINFNDEITSPGTLRTIRLPIAGVRFPAPQPQQPGAGTSPCRIAFDLAAARSNGLRTITSVTFNSPTEKVAPKYPVATGRVFGVYYPNGLE